MELVWPAKLHACLLRRHIKTKTVEAGARLNCTVMFAGDPRWLETLRGNTAVQSRVYGTQPQRV